MGNGIAPTLKHTLKIPAVTEDVAFSADSELLDCASLDSKVRVYGLEGQVTPMLKYALDDAMDWVFTVAFSPNSKLLASGSNDEKIRAYGRGDGAAAFAGDPMLSPFYLKTVADPLVNSRR